MAALFLLVADWPRYSSRSIPSVSHTYGTNALHEQPLILNPDIARFRRCWRRRTMDLLCHHVLLSTLLCYATHQMRTGAPPPFGPWYTPSTCTGLPPPFGP